MHYKGGWGGFGKFDMWGVVWELDSRGVVQRQRVRVLVLRYDAIYELGCVGVETPFTHLKN